MTNSSYDQLNRPTNVTWSPAATAAAPTASNVTFTHGYNAANQRISQGTDDNTWFYYPAASASSTSYTANALNQYTAVAAVTPTYDNNGNLTYDGTFTLGYDTENRLISASGAGNTVTYAYDSQGRRKRKTVNGTATIYVTDADNREVLEYNGSSGQVQGWYAYGGAGEVLNRMDVPGNTRQTLVPDVQGSVIATMDSTTGALTKRNYLPYGESAASTGTFAYTGLRIDPETNGFYYARARMYSPAWGRFLQADPIGYAGGRNLYAYTGNDPLNNIDLLGLWTLQVGGTINVNLFGVVYQYSGGVAVDGRGNISTFTAPGPGVGIGDRVSIGTTVLYSPNAPNVGALQGPFVNGSYGAALGSSASIDFFQDPSSPVRGAGFTIGLGVGGGMSVTKTVTELTSVYSPSQTAPAANSSSVGRQDKK